MREFRVTNRQDTDLLKVVVNDDGDAIYINPADTSFIQRYGDFLSYLQETSDQLAAKSEELTARFEGRPLFSTREDGEEDVDVDQLVILAQIMSDTYQAVAGKIDALFGQDALKKYFKPFFAINPDFVPDEECINDFLEAMTPALSEAYGARAAAIAKKYSKARKGSSGKHNKTKDDLIAEYKAAKEQEADQ